MEIDQQQYVFRAVQGIAHCIGVGYGAGKACEQHAADQPGVFRLSLEHEKGNQYSSLCYLE